MSKPALETLLCEYREIRQEIRECMSAIDKNIATGFSVLGIIASIGIAVRDIRVLYVIPTLLFMFLMIHMIKSMSLGILGTYCYSIENKLRTMFQPWEISMEWEGGNLGFKSRSACSIIGFGVFLAFFPVAVVFVVLSVMCYQFWKPSAMIHIGEAVSLIVYAFACMRWYTITHRRNAVTNYEKSAEQPD